MSEDAVKQFKPGELRRLKRESVLADARKIAQELYISGMTFGQIAVQLNRQGKRTIRGGDFTYATVWNLLHDRRP